MLVVGGVAKTAPHFPKSTLAAAQEKFGMGAGQSGTWQLRMGMLIGLQGSWLQA